MLHTLLKKAQGGEDGGAIEKISNEMLNGLSNLLLASSVSYSDSSKETTDREIAEVGRIILYVAIHTHPYTSGHTYTYRSTSRWPRQLHFNQYTLSISIQQNKSKARALIA